MIFSALSPQFVNSEAACGSDLDPPFGQCRRDRGVIAFGFEQGTCECFNGGDPNIGCALVCTGEQDCSSNVDTPFSFSAFNCSDFADLVSFDVNPDAVDFEEQQTCHVKPSRQYLQLLERSMRMCNSVHSIQYFRAANLLQFGEVTGWRSCKGMTLTNIYLSQDILTRARVSCGLLKEIGYAGTNFFIQQLIRTHVWTKCRIETQIVHLTRMGSGAKIILRKIVEKQE